MPISIDEFDSHDTAEETNAERAIRFLARNADKAYKAVETLLAYLHPDR